MNPTILGIIGPGLPNQVPTLGLRVKESAEKGRALPSKLRGRSLKLSFSVSCVGFGLTEFIKRSCSMRPI